MIGWITATLIACIVALARWLGVLLRTWIRMRDQLRRERDLFRDAHLTTCRQHREAIQDGQSARADRDRALEAARIAGEVNAELRERVAGLERVLRAVSTLADRLHDHHGKAVAEIRRAADGLAPNCPAEQSTGNPRAIAGQSGWTAVADELPDDPDEPVAILMDGDQVCDGFWGYHTGWTDRYGDRLDWVTHWAWLPGAEGSGLGGLGGGDGVLDDIYVHRQSRSQLVDCVGEGLVVPRDPPLEADAREPVLPSEGGDRHPGAGDEVAKGHGSGAH